MRATPKLPRASAGDYGFLFDVTLEDLRSKSRTRTLTNARQIAMYLLRELTDMSLPRIGQELGGRDHTTVIARGTEGRGTNGRTTHYL